MFGHDVSKICAEASRVNFKGIYDYSVTSFTPTVSVTNIDLVNLYELGQQNVTGDSIANVLHSIVSSGHEHDGEVATDLELGRIVAALAKDEIGTLAPSDIVCDPAAGSGNLISAAIDLKGRTEWKPTSTNKETSSPTLFVSIRNHRYTMFPASCRFWIYAVSIGQIQP